MLVKSAKIDFSSWLDYLGYASLSSILFYFISGIALLQLCLVAFIIYRVHYRPHYGNNFFSNKKARNCSM